MNCSIRVEEPCRWRNCNFAIDTAVVLLVGCSVGVIWFVAVVVDGEKVLWTFSC